MDKNQLADLLSRLLEDDPDLETDIIQSFDEFEDLSAQSLQLSLNKLLQFTPFNTKMNSISNLIITLAKENSISKHQFFENLGKMWERNETKDHKSQQ